MNEFRLSVGWLVCLCLVLFLGGSMSAMAEAPRVLPPGELPDDQRLGDLTTLNPSAEGQEFFLKPCNTPQEWEKRSERMRRQLLVATGLWPIPTKTPDNAVIHGKVDRGDYTVEKVYLESFPGHFVTGNLYRPKGRGGRGPGVLCPHGHWADGRFYDAGEKKLGQQIERGAEKFDPSGRYPIQARCVKLARMGCTVFHYDMVGYADSKQISHRPGLREEMNTPKDWGYFSPQAEARQQNMMGLQTYNSTRVLDWFSGLAEIDPQRIAVTGASGGGTQTFILCAVDQRPAVSFPAVMVSTKMQGGCTCENACYLRIDGGNIDIAALIAPRPLGMTAADDWSNEIMTRGLPQLKQHYGMLGVEELVMAQYFQFPHNYNYVSRNVMYGWLDKHLDLGEEKPIVEEDFQPLEVEEMTVWNDEHPKPAGGDDHERSLLRWITEDSDKQMADLIPSDADSLAEYRRIVGGAVDVMIGHGLPEPGQVESEAVGDASVGDIRLIKVLARNLQRSEEIPATMLIPGQWNHEVTIWIDPTGKQGLFDQDGKPKQAVGQLLSAGMAVVGVDLFGQGEFTTDGKPLDKNRLDPDRTTFAGYTYGYNHPLFSQRVHDILSMIAVTRSKRNVQKVHLVGMAGAGHWVAAARAQAGGVIDRTVVDTGRFRFADLTSFDDADFLPGGAKYLDLPGILALSAPGELWLAGEGPDAPKVVAAAYQAAGSLDRVTVSDLMQSEREQAAVQWLLR